MIARMRIALGTLALALGFGTAHAQVRAPAAPAAPRQPKTLDLDASSRANAWRDLERTWRELSASPTASAFARGASSVCVQAYDWRDGEPPPGLRAGLITQSCQGALQASVAQRDVADQSVQTWQRGFVPLSEHGAIDCLALEQLAPMIGDVVKDSALLQRFQDARQRCGSQEKEAQRGREALGLPLCERITALSDMLEDTGKLDWGARQLAQSDDADALQSRWARLAGRQARFQHVVAYHLAEARIELASFAEQAARVPKLADANEVREAFQCLGEFRGANARLREFERRLQDG